MILKEHRTKAGVVLKMTIKEEIIYANEHFSVFAFDFYLVILKQILISDK